MKPEEIQQRNDEIVAERGPGLYWDMGTYVIVKDTARNRVMLGGLGGFGIGRMWVDNPDGLYDDSPGFTEAPEDPDRLDNFGATSWRSA